MILITHRIQWAKEHESERSVRRQALRNAVRCHFRSTKGELAAAGAEKNGGSHRLGSSAPRLGAAERNRRSVGRRAHFAHAPRGLPVSPLLHAWIAGVRSRGATRILSARVRGLDCGGVHGGDNGDGEDNRKDKAALRPGCDVTRGSHNQSPQHVPCRVVFHAANDRLRGVASDLGGARRVNGS